jgi:hypothetical protein
MGAALNTLATELPHVVNMPNQTAQLNTALANIQQLLGQHTTQLGNITAQLTRLEVQVSLPCGSMRLHAAPCGSRTFTKRLDPCRRSTRWREPPTCRLTCWARWSP